MIFRLRIHSRICSCACMCAFVCACTLPCACGCTRVGLMCDVEVSMSVASTSKNLPSVARFPHDPSAVAPPR